VWKSPFKSAASIQSPMTDNQLTTRTAFIRDLQRNERLDVAVTVVWSTVMLLAVILTFALLAY